MKLFSYRNRPVHKGPYPTETLARLSSASDVAFDDAPPLTQLEMPPADDPTSIRHAMDDYQSLMDTIRDGPVNPQLAEIPECAEERSNNLKAAGYFLDATIAGSCEISGELRLETSFTHPRIAEWFEKCQTMIKRPLPPILDMAFGRIAMARAANRQSIDHHSHAIVYAVEYPREPGKDEPGSHWIQGLQQHRASLLAGELAVAIANYLRLLGYEARAHTGTSTDIDLHKAAIVAGIARADGRSLRNPFVGDRFGLAAVSTTLLIKADLPLAEQRFADKLRSKGPAWWLGTASHKSAFNYTPFKRRRFKDSMHAMGKIRTRDEPTTLIDADRIPRMPKRSSFFNRAFIGDLGKGPRDASIDGAVVLRHPVGAALTSMLNTYSILQRGKENSTRSNDYSAAQANSDRIKATLHFLGADLVGISEAPDWVWYSHELDGRPVDCSHKYAITTLIDQGHETMEGASGDDWLSAAQSMRAYMRASLLNGVVTQHLRNLGFPATNHTASDGDVLQPPLVLLSGLGEVSRIGDVMLNPYLGPRLKCGVITTDFPMTVDKPIDFGLQTFCDNCNKCARECPSGAISAGEKVMYNGYELWRSDPEKCTRYRMTNSGGSMCGRCMKTCPWNLEGIFKEAPYRFLATRFPSSARTLTRIDDWLGNGEINPVKKWWWDLDGGAIGPATVPSMVNERQLSKDYQLRPEDQTLACYPAETAPSPYMVSQPLNREEGIKIFNALRSPEEYRTLLKNGTAENLAAKYVVPVGPPPVIPVLVRRKTPVSADGEVMRFEFVALGDMPLPSFEAGAHIDVMIAPQFIRPYSLCSDPRDPTSYVIGVLNEEGGTGGSRRIHQRLAEGKVVMISRPRNHFPLKTGAKRSLLLAGGIGVTPLIAMAHELHRDGAEFSFYFKASTRARAGFVEELTDAPWSDRVHCFFSDENRLAVADVLTDYQPGDELYVCGPSAFMDAVFESALAQGWLGDSLHREYFTVPGDIEYENFGFQIKLQRSGVVIAIPADTTAADALTAAGYPIDTKCSDGLCGVCTADYVEGEIEHRDFLLSNAQRKKRLTLCCSRAAKPGGEVVLDM